MDASLLTVQRDKYIIHFESYFLFRECASREWKSFGVRCVDWAGNQCVSFVYPMRDNGWRSAGFGEMHKQPEDTLDAIRRHVILCCACEPNSYAILSSKSNPIRPFSLCILCVLNAIRFMCIHCGGDHKVLCERICHRTECSRNRSGIGMCGKRQQIVKIPQTTQLHMAIKAFSTRNIEKHAHKLRFSTNFYSLVATIEAQLELQQKFVTIGRQFATTMPNANVKTP